MTSSKGRTTSKGKKTQTSNRRNYKNTQRRKKRNTVDPSVINEAVLILLLAVTVFIFLCLIHIIRGSMANVISDIMFGLFGLLAYVVPLLCFLGVAFEISNKGNTVAILKLVCGIILLFVLGNIFYLLMQQENLLSETHWIKELYNTSAEKRAGGGVIFGILSHALHKLVGVWGTIFIDLVVGIACVVIITEKSFLSGVKKGSSYLYETVKEDMERIRYENGLEDEEEYEFIEEEEILAQKERRKKRNAEQTNQNVEELPKEKQRRMDHKASGVVPMSAITLEKKSVEKQIKSDIHEIVMNEEELENASKQKVVVEAVDEWMSSSDINTVSKPLEKNFLDELNDLDISQMPEPNTENSMTTKAEVQIDYSSVGHNDTSFHDEETKKSIAKKFTPEEKEQVKLEEEKIVEQVQTKAEPIKKYMFPPIHLLKKGTRSRGDASNLLKETAYRLQQTLLNFGVKVTITDISQGPSVTRYEMQPEQGVKVSKIVGLADDIKLNLAATDIRIEAPIPGKAAVGIEVPNKENSTVMLRDLLETDDFKNFNSNLAFAVGKDIGGKVVVADIAKMPHVLIAGATGSGKSVCINTIIMSILYKANPNDVKMIMIDPKVVELSVYNGIPHLMIPVVTDPKKASAALHWGVAEMTDRYQKFAEMNVRDLKGYNSAVESGKLSADGQPLTKMPQIVIIVDELADLMMVASGEVEESICRLAQLARAAGIHLIIATQRPSVDVITGLIKANMPSRIAFSVSSGVDSRTIIDMNGAEKLLGKGDMLFYPQGYAKPGRVQGAFVSDSEVSDVVEFLKNQQLGNVQYSNEIEEKIKSSMQNGNGGAVSSSGGSDFDTYFADAGRFVIEKDKASIGMLQRVFKIGFNRAARIVDQLEGAGVVGAEEGTKPRKILMNLEQFETFIEENL